MVKTKDNMGGFYPRSPIPCGRGFRPYAIGDPRGRAAGRASAGAAARSILECQPESRRDRCALCAPTV